MKINWTSPTVYNEDTVNSISEKEFVQVKVFWVLTVCSVAIGYWCFRGPCCLHPQGEVIGAGKWGIDIGREYKRGYSPAVHRKRTRKLILAVRGEWYGVLDWLLHVQRGWKGVQSSPTRYRLGWQWVKEWGFVPDVLLLFVQGRSEENLGWGSSLPIPWFICPTPNMMFHSNLKFCNNLQNRY